MTQALDLDAAHLSIVLDILHRYVPQYEVWAFGSRVTGKTKPYSDLDLAIITEQPLELSIRSLLAEDFAESDLPIKVDIVDWSAISEAFRAIISQAKIVV